MIKRKNNALLNTILFNLCLKCFIKDSNHENHKHAEALGFFML